MEIKEERQSKKDMELLREIIRATENERIRWLPTAKLNEYTGSFNGRWSVLVGRDAQGGHTVEITDDQGHVVLRLSDRDLPMLSAPTVRDLFEAASRNAFHSDKGVDEFLQDLKQP